jgi:amidase
MHDDLVNSSANEIARGVATKQFSVTEVMSAFLQQVDRANPTLNAICTINPRADDAARASDRRLASGKPARPLEGVPFVVKDVIHTKGVRTTFGSKLLENLIPDEDSISVERLQAAGGILIGKANTPEFAHDVNTTNKIFGTTRNPWNLDVTAGGSSGGTASAIAGAMAPIGLGTDLGGSIRIPSAFCGIVGLRPAPGRVPVYPADFGWDTLVEHVQGPMAATVADIGAMLSVLAGPDDRDPSSMPSQRKNYASASCGAPNLTGRRIAYSHDLNGLMPVDPEVADLTRRAAEQFEFLGCVVDEACFDVSDAPEIISGTRAFGMIARYADRLASSKELLTPQLIAQVSDSLKIDARTITRAERLRTEYWHRARRFLDRYDYIMLPTVGVPAFHLYRPLPTTIGGKPIGRFYDVFLGTYAFSITGLPTISVPCGWNSEGLPVGLQIVGRRLREDMILEAAAAYAQACPTYFAKPKMMFHDVKVHTEAVVTTGYQIR